MRRVRLTEGQLHRIIRNAVNKSLMSESISINDLPTDPVDWNYDGEFCPWTKDNFEDLVYTYMDADDVTDDTITDTPWGDNRFVFVDAQTLRVFFDSSKEASDFAHSINSSAGDCYECSYGHSGDSVDVRVPNI